MRILHKVLIFGILACLLSYPVMEANPGGNGDGTRDFACGGSCHADPDVSGPSSAVISVWPISLPWTNVEKKIKIIVTYNLIILKQLSNFLKK